MSKNPIEELVIPNRVAVFEDHKTKVKTVAFPFQFPDGKQGVISITRLSKLAWNPADDIETVHIVWNKDKQFSS